jgi:hypothetical protein
MSSARAAACLVLALGGAVASCGSGLGSTTTRSLPGSLDGEPRLSASAAAANQTQLADQFASYDLSDLQLAAYGSSANQPSVVLIAARTSPSTPSLAAAMAQASQGHAVAMPETQSGVAMNCAVATSEVTAVCIWQADGFAIIAEAQQLTSATTAVVDSKDDLGWM